MSIKLKIRILITLTLLGFPFGALANDAEPSFFSSTYNFNPHELNDKQIDEKSARIDILWNKVESEPDKYISDLRTALNSDGLPPFFYYDAGKLLIHISDDYDDKKIALSALSKVDIRDVIDAEYLKTVHGFAVEGLDTTEAALKILDHDNFKAIIPQHSLSLEQDFSLIYMLITMDEYIYVSRLVKELKNTKSEKSTKSLILAIWYTSTKEGNKALADYSTNDSNPKVLKNYAKDLIARNKKVHMSMGRTQLSVLRKHRRIIMKSISNEALYKLNPITRKIIAKSK